jgi:ribosomal protein S12 methylthiotransferase
VLEAEQLADSGVLELNLVSQDTVAYGRDEKGAPGLAALLERLGDVRGIEWLRLHYLYPEKLDERLLEILRDHPKVLPYVDMPLQHAAPSMLRRMLRGGSTNLRAVIDRLRQSVPNVVLRSAFIVGHPGETDAEFEELAGFIRWAELDHVGVFQYSDEETCASHALADKVDDETTEARATALIDLQRGISLKKNQAQVGRELRVLVEGASEESELVMIGRHAGQAPEVDGVVYLSHGPVQPGSFCTAHVVSATDYDLLAEAEPTQAPAARRPKSAARTSNAVRRRRGVVSLRTIS